MVKKTLALILALGFVLIALCSCGGAPAATTESGGEEAMIDTPYEYPIQPGSDEWKSLSLAERFEVCTVDRALAERMTTGALLETVLNYPFITQILDPNLLQSDSQKGVSLKAAVEGARGQFAPLDVFLDRSDAYATAKRVADQYEESEEAELLAHYYASDSLVRYLEQADANG